MNFNNKWRDYLTESKDQIDETEITAKMKMDGKVISKDTSNDFTKGDEYSLKADHGDIKGCGSDLPKSLVIKVPDDKADFVGVNPSGKNKYRKISAGTIKKCYTKVSADDDDKGKGENDEMVLDEMCGGDHTPAVMMPEPVGGDQHQTRRVTPHDREGRMAKAQLYKITKYAMEIMENLHDDDELASWVQSKITKAASYMSAAKHYLEYEYTNPPHMDDVMPMMESTQKKVDEIFEEAIGSKKKSS